MVKTLFATVLVLVTLIIGSARGFAPFTRPHETTVSSTCVICAFVMEELARVLPVELAVVKNSLPREASVVTSPGAMRQLALSINGTVTHLISDGFAYNVDQHHVRVAPPDARHQEAAEDDFENELPTIIKARRDRRVAAGLAPSASPWLLSSVSDFFTQHLDVRLRFYIQADDPHVDAQTPSNVTGASVHDIKVAAQSREDGPHDADFVRMIGAALDTIRLERLEPPPHFFARFGCVVELQLCPEAADVLDADDAEQIVEEVAESPEVLYRAVHQEPIHENAIDTSLRQQSTQAFMDAFLGHLSNAVYHHEASRRVTGPTAAERLEQVGGVDALLDPEDEAALHGITDANRDPPSVEEDPAATPLEEEDDSVWRTQHEAAFRDDM